MLVWARTYTLGLSDAASVNRLDEMHSDLFEQASTGRPRVARIANSPEL